MPDFPIVDSHLHIYDPGAIRFDWMKDVPRLNRAHSIADFDIARGGVAVDMMVFVEVDAATGLHIDEAQWVAAQAAKEPRLRGMVASAPLHLGAQVEPDLKRLSGIPLTRGIRELIQGHVNEPGWALRDGFVEGMQLLPKYGLSFDICIVHPQLKDVTELCRRCPDVTFVLDHIAKPGIGAGLLEPWRTDILALAALPNVSCKISGATTEADHASWQEREIAPYIAHAIHCFGFDRVMFGGDWPVCELATRYDRWVKLVDSVVASASKVEQRKLYRDNAIRFYRL